MSSVVPNRGHDRVGSSAGKPKVIPPFAVGIRIVTQSRTVTSGDFAAIVNASWEFGPLHSDAVAASGSIYGRPILGGPCLIAMGAGLSAHDLYTSWHAGGYDCYAALGIDEIRYRSPVMVDDTIRMEVEVAEFTPTTHGSAMFCRLNDVMKNQRDEVVLTMHRRYLLKGLAE